MSYSRKGIIKEEFEADKGRGGQGQDKGNSLARDACAGAPPFDRSLSSNDDLCLKDNACEGMGEIWGAKEGGGPHGVCALDSSCCG